MKNLITLIFIGILAVGCAATDVQPINESFAPSGEEKMLWKQSLEAQEMMDKGDLLYEDTEMVAYLNEVARRLWPDNFARQNHMILDVQIIKDPQLNAFTFPNGKIYVHTGFLARMENEAQLATLLAHEMAHAINRDALASYHDLKNKTAFLNTLGVAAAGFGGYGDLATLAGSLVIVSSIAGYSQGLEAAADRFGLEQMIKAGYDPNEAPKMFSLLQEWLEINDINEPFFFGSHPRLEDRVRSYNFLLATEFKGVSGEKKGLTYQEKMKDIILLNSALNIKAGRFKVAEQDIWTYIDRQNESAEAFFLLGEICTQNDDDKDTDKAIEFYNYAVHLDAEFPKPYRELGLIYFKKDNKLEAEKNFSTYLKLAPDALDRGYIEENLKTIRQGS
jgi:tetratricopeptide (TPR) repeat protein